MKFQTFKIVMTVQNLGEKGTKVSIEPDKGLDEETEKVCNDLLVAVIAASNLVFCFNPDGVQEALYTLKDIAMRKANFMQSFIMGELTKEILKTILPSDIAKEIFDSLTANDEKTSEPAEDVDVPDAFKAFLDKLDFDPKPGSQSVDKGGE